MEIYVAICRPLISQRYFTAHRTNLWILGLWLVTLVYCAPWLYLTDVRPDPDLPTIQLCDFRTSTRHFTRYYFLADLVLFYLIPLIVAVVVYTKIGRVLHRADQGTLMRATGADEERAEKSIDDTENSSSHQRHIPQDQIAAGASLLSSNPVTPSTCQTISPEINKEDRHHQRDKKTSRDRAKSRAHVRTVRMLAKWRRTSWMLIVRSVHCLDKRTTKWRTLAADKIVDVRYLQRINWSNLFLEWRTCSLLLAARVRHLAKGLVKFVC